MTTAFTGMTTKELESIFETLTKFDLPGDLICMIVGHYIETQNKRLSIKIKKTMVQWSISTFKKQNNLLYADYCRQIMNQIGSQIIV